MKTTNKQYNLWSNLIDRMLIHLHNGLIDEAIKFSHDRTLSYLSDDVQYSKIIAYYRGIDVIKEILSDLFDRNVDAVIEKEFEFCHWKGIPIVATRDQIKSVLMKDKDSIENQILSKI